MASGGFTLDDDGPTFEDDGTFFPVLPVFADHDLHEPRPDVWVGGLTDVEGVVARTEAVAVVVRSLVAHPGGFTFTLTTHHADRTEGHAMFGPFPDANQALRLGLLYPDGTKVLSDPFGRPSEAAAVHGLLPGGGSSDGWSTTTDYRAWPLPGPGALTFVVRWRAMGIEDIRWSLDASRLIEAAARARRLWD